jgi:hypothetical protein
MYERLFVGDSTFASVPPFESIYWRVAPLYYRWRFSRELSNYEHPPDPFKIERVDPTRITQYSGREYPPWKDREFAFGSVQGGDWDRRDLQTDPRAAESLTIADDFTSSAMYRSLHAHFAEGVPWRSTSLYQVQSERIDDNEYGWPDSQKDLERRYRALDQIYEQIAEKGYRTQIELRDSGKRIDAGFTDSTRYPKGFLELMSHEIAVDVGRDGQLLFVDGRHRLAIAKILGLDTVPIVFLVRHSDWMEQRDIFAEGESVLDHPDFRDM